MFCSASLRSLISVPENGLNMAKEQHYGSEGISQSEISPAIYSRCSEKGCQLGHQLLSPVIMPLILIVIVLTVLLVTACAWTLGSQSLPVVSIAWASQVTLGIAKKSLERQRSVSHVDAKAVEQAILPSMHANQL